VLGVVVLWLFFCRFGREMKKIQKMKKMASSASVRLSVYPMSNSHLRRYIYTWNLSLLIHSPTIRHD
jgi:hypothetical protein